MKFLHAMSIQMLQNAGDLFVIERRQFGDAKEEQEVIYKLKWLHTIEAPLYNYERIKCINISTGNSSERTVLGWASIYTLTRAEVLKYAEKMSINVDFIDYEA